MTNTSDIMILKRRKSLRVNENILAIILMLFFISESLSKILYMSNLSFNRVSAVVKIGFLVYYAFILKNFKGLKWIILLSIVFFVSQIFVLNPDGWMTGLCENLLYFAKYMYIFILANFIKDYSTYGGKEKALKFVLYIIRWNSILILIGFVFEIDLFSTYLGKQRFGYDGLIQVNSQASFIYIFILIYVFNNWINNKTFSLDIILFTLSGLFIGTKTLYLFYVFLMIYLLFYFKLGKLFFLVTIMGGILIYLNLETFISIMNSFSLYRERGMLTFLFSFRNDLLIETYNLAINNYWSWVNYILGGGFFYKIRTEMAFFDLYLFWGIFSIVYLKMYYDAVLKVYFNENFLMYNICVVLFIAFLGGNFFTNAVISFYILIISDQFKNRKILNFKKTVEICPTKQVDTLD